MSGYKPTSSSDWGLGGHKPAEKHTYDEPFAADTVPRDAPEPEEDGSGIEPIPGRCVVICITPVAAKRSRWALMTRHGEEYLEKVPCPLCGAQARVQVMRPVQTCPDCDGAGHVPDYEHEPSRLPAAARLVTQLAISPFRRDHDAIHADLEPAGETAGEREQAQAQSTFPQRQEKLTVAPDAP